MLSLTWKPLCLSYKVWKAKIWTTLNNVKGGGMCNAAQVTAGHRSIETIFKRFKIIRADDNKRDDIKTSSLLGDNM